MSAFSADNLLRWHDAQHYTVKPLRRLKPNAHGNCARFIPAERFILVIVELWYAGGCSPLRVDLKVLEAGGYSQLATQQAKSTSVNSGAQRPFCSVVARRISRPAKAGSKSAGDRTGKCFDAPQVKSRVGVPWFQMGYQLGDIWCNGRTVNH